MKPFIFYITQTMREPDGTIVPMSKIKARMEKDYSCTLLEREDFITPEQNAAYKKRIEENGSRMLSNGGWGRDGTTP